MLRPFTARDHLALADPVDPLPPLPAHWPRDLLDPDGLRPTTSQAQTAADHDLMRNVQCNILKSHGRQRAALVLFRCQPGPRDRAFWRHLATAVTSAATQRAQAKLYRQHREAPATWAEFAAPLQASEALGRAVAAPADQVCRSVLFTAEGLHDLRVADDPAIPLQFEVSRAHPESFNAGQETIARQNGEDTGAWAAEYRQRLGGAWLLACDDAPQLAAEVEATIAWCTAHGLEPIATEFGFDWQPRPPGTPANATVPSREAFGFADGISVPAFLEDERARGRMGGPWVDGGLSQALISPQESRRHAGGSLMVLRKLEQDVAAFRRLEARLQAAGAGGAPVLIGRTPDGDPLGPLHAPAHAERAQNAFTFDDGRCPYHAHIRKMNPRDRRVLSPADNRRAQPVRRGMVYDPNLKFTPGQAGASAPDRDVGLLFMAYATNLWMQFERQQWVWSGPDFPRRGTDPDPLLHPTKEWRWQGHRCPVDAPLVRVQGGAYFYAPSLAWLRSHA